MRRAMTDKGVAALKRKPKAYSRPDPELRGHWVRVQPSGTKSFWTIARDPNQKQIWTYIGPCDATTIEEARARARIILRRVRAGLPVTSLRHRSNRVSTVVSTRLKNYAISGHKR
jgi:hypothetical protein